jgi:hypothetical protein
MAYSGGSAAMGAVREGKARAGSHARALRHGKANATPSESKCLPLCVASWARPLGPPPGCATTPREEKICVTATAVQGKTPPAPAAGRRTSPIGLWFRRLLPPPERHNTDSEPAQPVFLYRLFTQYDDEYSGVGYSSQEGPLPPAQTARQDTVSYPGILRRPRLELHRPPVGFGNSRTGTPPPAPIRRRSRDTALLLPDLAQTSDAPTLSGRQ